MTWLNNCRNDLLEDHFKLPIMNVAPANASYAQVSGSSINIDTKNYTAFNKARLIISWGNITNADHTAYAQLRDQSGNVLLTVSRFMPKVLTTDTQLGNNWYIDITADGDRVVLTNSVTSVSLYVYSSNGGAVNITTAFVEVTSVK